MLVVTVSVFSILVKLVKPLASGYEPNVQGNECIFLVIQHG